MTLNVTLVNPRYIIQASDRRMVSIPDGKRVNDDANKGLVLQTEDGIFSITFTGVGLFNPNSQRIDLWLAERMLDEGIPELPIRHGLDIMAGLATDLFGTFPRNSEKRHTFVVAGWVTSEAKRKPALWLVTNCAGLGQRMPEQARDSFDVQRIPVSSSRGTLHWTGLVGAIARSDRPAFEAALRKSTDLDQVEQAVVTLIRTAAAKPKWCRGINGDVLSIAISPDGQACSTFYPESAPASNYAPLFVWYDAGRNIIVGDADITPASGRVYRFGRAMLVDAPGAERELSSVPIHPSQIRFRMRISEPKFKKEARGDSPIITAFRVKEVKRS